MECELILRNMREFKASGFQLGWMACEGQGGSCHGHQRVEKQESNEEARVKRAEAGCYIGASTVL